MGNSTYFRILLKLLEHGFLTSLSSPELHYSVLLLPEAAALGEPGTTSGGLAEDCGAPSAHHNCLGGAEHSGDPVASRALDVHEEGVGVLDDPLQLVFSLFIRVQWVQQVL